MPVTASFTLGSRQVVSSEGMIVSREASVVSVLALLFVCLPPAMTFITEVEALAPQDTMGILDTLLGWPIPCCCRSGLLAP